MVKAISATRDAEKAMEEARKAANKAEVEFIKAKKNIAEMARLVRDDSEGSG